MIDESRRQLYAGIWVMKKLDLEPEDGGVTLPLLLPHDWAPLEGVLDRLVMDGLVAMNRGKGRYELTPRGIETVGMLIDEAETYIEEFDGVPAPELVRQLERRKVDPVRVRFLWGWYQGELDDLVLFQQRRGIAEVEHDWAEYLVGEGLWRELGRDLAGERA
jgi:hypothetical protein